MPDREYTLYQGDIVLIVPGSNQRGIPEVYEISGVVIGSPNLADKERGLWRLSNPPNK